MDPMKEYISMVTNYAPAGVVVGDERHGFVSQGNGKWRNNSGMEVASSHVWVYWVDHMASVTLGVVCGDDDDESDLTEE